MYIYYVATYSSILKLLKLTCYLPTMRQIAVIATAIYKIAAVCIASCKIIIQYEYAVIL